MTATLAMWFIGRDAADDGAQIAGQKLIEALHRDLALLREGLGSLAPPPTTLTGGKSASESVKASLPEL